ncbi:MAG: DUF2207 domain-containing protein [Alphaproteobacteria bacterium]|nr:DUF2207 domain-containing protein [Alphaproteobacteria bacterium]
MAPETFADYDPPRAMSPALARSIYIGGYDTRTFAVAILSLARDGFIEMRTEDNGEIIVSRRESVWPPRSKAANWLFEALVGRSDFSIGRVNYLRLKEIRRGHAERLRGESTHEAGTGGVFIMAGFGLAVLMSVMVAAIISRAPMGVPVLDVLAPYWPFPVAAVGGLWLWRRNMLRKQAAVCPDRVELDRYRRFIEVAMADRLNPRFVADGTYKFDDADTVYAAAFGLENAWADPLVHRLESLLTGPLKGTDLDTAVETGKLTEKRGFAPRKQSSLWGGEDDFWFF